MCTIASLSSYWQESHLLAKKLLTGIHGCAINSKQNKMPEKKREAPFPSRISPMLSSLLAEGTYFEILLQ
jgi:hypothetical protein